MSPSIAAVCSTRCRQHFFRPFAGAFSTASAVLTGSDPTSRRRRLEIDDDWQQRFPGIGARAEMKKRPIAGVQTAIAVSSAKGGVGKSTIAANIALGVAMRGFNVGILDCDVHGPSIPLLLGTSQFNATVSDDNKILPVTSHGISSMSMANLAPGTGPVAWRGLMVTKAIQQLLFQIQWPDLQLLVLDLPPGTGDVHLTIAQQTALDGIVVVSTPQQLALSDTVRGISLFQKMDIPILGFVQNMSFAVCGHCGERNFIFGKGHAEQFCRDHKLDFFGHIPIDAQISLQSDSGRPAVLFDKSSAGAGAINGIIDSLLKRMNIIPR